MISISNLSACNQDSGWDLLRDLLSSDFVPNFSASFGEWAWLAGDSLGVNIDQCQRSCLGVLILFCTSGFPNEMCLFT